jgi:hypothetical protein
MKTHSTVFAALNVALGIVGMLGAGFIAITLVFGGAVTGVTGDEIAAASMITIGILTTGVVLALSVPCLVLGVMILKRGDWSPGLGLTASVVDLVNFPIGTIVGGYGLWIASQARLYHRN